MDNKISAVLIRAMVGLLLICSAGHVGACTISEDMEDSLPLNSIHVSNADRLKILDMVFSARQWPDVEIRGIVYAGGYILENDPESLAKKRASALKDYLIQLGISNKNIWVDERIIKSADVDDHGNVALNQIGVTLVPICTDGCERLCNDSRVTPASKAIR